MISRNCPTLAEPLPSPSLGLGDRCRVVSASQADVAAGAPELHRGDVLALSAPPPSLPTRPNPQPPGPVMSHRRHAALLLWDGDSHSPAIPSKSSPFPETQPPPVNWG